MYGNPYMQNYSTPFGQQTLNERIDTQIAQLNQMKEQMKNQQPTSINQTFQLAPNSHTMRYANTIDDVSKETVYFDTPFFSKDMSVLWVKGVNGVIKSYELKEIVKKDERDLLIESLQMQVTELRKEIKDNAKSIDDNDVKSNQNEESTNVSNVRTSKKKQ
jgi:hypothetical protein